MRYATASTGSRRCCFYKNAGNRCGAYLEDASSPDELDETTDFRMTVQKYDDIAPTAERAEEKSWDAYVDSLEHKETDVFSFTYPYEKEINIPSKTSVTEIKKGKDQAAYRPVLESADLAGDAMERGTAVHLVMQHIDLKRCADEQAVKREIAKLVEHEIITQKEAQMIDPAWVTGFLRLEIAKRMQKADRVYKELPFTLQKTAKELGLSDLDTPVVVQGVIDLCFIERGKWVVVDYKTDNVDTRTAPGRAAGVPGTAGSVRAGAETDHKDGSGRKIPVFFPRRFVQTIAGLWFFQSTGNQQDCQQPGTHNAGK